MMRLAKHLIKRPTCHQKLEQQYVEAKQLSADRKWAAALKLYNEILTVQRNELGEDHINCGKTLNDIGVVLIQMGENFPASSALKEALYIRKKTLEVDAPEVVETCINIDVLMEKVNQIEEEATNREKQRKFVQIQQSLGLTDIDQCDITNTTDHVEKEERREIARKIITQSLAIHRQMSYTNEVQNQSIPSKIIDMKLKLKKSRSGSIPESNSSLVMSIASSINYITGSAKDLFSGVDDKSEGEFNQIVWIKERGRRMSMVPNDINPHMNINLWEEKPQGFPTRCKTH